jgi:hypothetical protein
MTGVNRSTQFVRKTMRNRSDARNEAKARSIIVECLRAHATRCADLAERAVALGVTNDFDRLAQEYESAAVLLESGIERSKLRADPCEPFLELVP